MKLRILEKFSQPTSGFHALQRMVKRLEEMENIDAQMDLFRKVFGTVPKHGFGNESVPMEDTKAPTASWEMYDSVEKKKSLTSFQLEKRILHPKTPCKELKPEEEKERVETQIQNEETVEETEMIAPMELLDMNDLIQRKEWLNSFKTKEKMSLLENPAKDLKPEHEKMKLDQPLSPNQIWYEEEKNEQGQQRFAMPLCVGDHATNWVFRLEPYLEFGNFLETKQIQGVKMSFGEEILKRYRCWERDKTKWWVSENFSVTQAKQKTAKWQRKEEMPHKYGFYGLKTGDKVEDWKNAQGVERENMEMGDMPSHVRGNTLPPRVGAFLSLPKVTKPLDSSSHVRTQWENKNSSSTAKHRTSEPLKYWRISKTWWFKFKNKGDARKSQTGFEYDMSKLYAYLMMDSDAVGVDFIDGGGSFIVKSIYSVWKQQAHSEVCNSPADFKSESGHQHLQERLKTIFLTASGLYENCSVDRMQPGFVASGVVQEIEASSECDDNPYHKESHPRKHHNEEDFQLFNLSNHYHEASTAENGIVVLYRSRALIFERQHGKNKGLPSNKSFSPSNLEDKVDFKVGGNDRCER